MLLILKAVVILDGPKHFCGNNDFVGLLQYSLQKLKLLLAEWSVVKSSLTVSFYHVVDTLFDTGNQRQFDLKKK